MVLVGVGQVGPICRVHPTLLTACLAQWRKALASHRDGEFVRYVLEGLEHDIHVGYTASTPHSNFRGNLLFTRLHPEVIDDYLSAEVWEGI